ncbi:MAG: hypothetical protein IJS58_03555 [Bacilli bacterium]|nr:hypothetical protein [Bacilli bacterium]
MQKKNRPLYEFWYSHPKFVTAFLLLIANIVITLIFTLILYFITNQTMTIIEAFQYCFLMGLCSDPIWSIRETFEGDFNIYLIFHIIMTIIQMITFSGSLIGFATTVLDSFFSNMEETKRKLKLANHFVILNWNNLGPNIVYDLSFLKGKKTIVILANQEREEIINSINNIFSANKKARKNLNIFVKNGDPANSRHLMDISIDKAQSIGILLDSSWENEREPKAKELSTRDLNAFRLLMSIIHLVDDINIVVESETDLLDKKIKSLFRHTRNKRANVCAFSHKEIIGHIMGKGIINKDYIDFYDEILSYEGVEFYGINPIPIEEALENYNNFIPIINYNDESDKRCKDEPNHLYILNSNSLLSKRSTPLKFERRIDTHLIKLEKECHYLIVGNNGALKHILEELETYKKVNNELLTYESFSYDEINEVIDKAGEMTGEVRILLLSGNDVNTDANIFINLLSLKLDYSLKDNVQIYVEINNPSNYTSVKNMGVAKTIVSSKMISLFMIQLMTHQHSKKFYLDVLTPNGNESGKQGDIGFDICNASKYLDVTEPIIFKSKAEALQVFYLSTSKKYLMIGYKKENDDKISFLCGDLDKEENIVIDKDTNIIVAVYE